MAHPPINTLARQINDERLKAFIEHWETLERLVLRVCKTKTALEEDETEYRELHAWLVKEYPRWQAELEMFLPAAGGEAGRLDPFGALLGIENASGLVADESSIDLLHAAHEALSHFLVALIRGRPASG